jgi:hypothetical protein
LVTAVGEASSDSGKSDQIAAEPCKQILATGQDEYLRALGCPGEDGENALDPLSRVGERIVRIFVAGTLVDQQLRSKPREPPAVPACAMPSKFCKPLRPRQTL